MMKSSNPTRKTEPKPSSSRSKPKPGTIAESSTSAATRGQKRKRNDDDDGVSHELSAAAQELKRQVQEVYSSIDGNTADGRWTIISRMLKLPCTRGERVWITPRAGEIKEPESETIAEQKSDETVVEGRSPRSPRSAKKLKEARLKEKVESWQKNVVVVAEQKASPRDKTRSVKKKSAEMNAVEMDVDCSPLGFHAQKTVSSQVKAKMKGRKADGKQPAREPLPEPSSDTIEPPEQDSRRPATRRKLITEVPEHNFIPPSFPSSQIQHSTPFRKPSLRPPSPIPFAQTSPLDPHEMPPPTSSPQSGVPTSPIATVTRNKVHRAAKAAPTASPAKPHSKPPFSRTRSPIPSLGLSTSLPVIGSPKQPTRAEMAAARLGTSSASNPKSGDYEAKNLDIPALGTKRPRPVSPEASQRAKQRRMGWDVPNAIERQEGVDVVMQAPSSPLSSPPKTPKKSEKNILPTLTELLSAKKSATPKGKSRRISGSGGLDVHVATADGGRDAHRRDSSATNAVNGISSHSQAPSNKVETQRTTGTTTSSIQGRQPGWEDVPIQSEDPNLLQSLPEPADGLDLNAGYGFDITAPARSLPSLDSFEESGVAPGVDVADDGDIVSIAQSSAKGPVLVPDSPAIPDFTFDPDEFSPQLTSTQQKAVAAGTVTGKSAVTGGVVGGKVRSDVFMGTDAKDIPEEDLLLFSPPKRSPVRGGAARYTSETQSQSRSPSKTPSKSQSQFPWGYSSQMDLEGGVDRVSRFLEKDLSMIDLDDDETGERADKLSMGTRGWVY
ncbi:hypothetical protein PM082_009954 [Marasmius tenuissimus]|nr:hypothetical protein PM082_009954 [Marasmius tenuissimus]